jgi:hypothetical protein
MSFPNITYEFYFPNGDFDQTIFDSYGSNDFQLQTNVIEKVNIIKDVFLSNTTNLHIFSTFLEYYDGKTNLVFKITVVNPQF